MSTSRRLIEVAFPLKQASIDSIREKTGPLGHISTLHVWPARRPLAACRAALIATLLPDPGDPEERRKLLEMIAGKVVSKPAKKGGGKGTKAVREETEGGILHWGRESGPGMDEIRQRIRKAYGGRAPRVLDPFAGGGAIPLEAMRLGCEAFAGDINPVAWFILKCTLEYPQKLAAKTWPLPQFALESKEFMAEVQKAQGKAGRGKDATNLEMFERREMGLEWHVCAWGGWVLERARKDLEHLYPEIDGKPTVAYLWARTVRCKNCRATIPLLKTGWLCAKEGKRIALVMAPKKDKTGVEFRLDDKPKPPRKKAPGGGLDLGSGTMTRAGATCPCCNVIMTMEDIAVEGRAGRMSATMTAVVVDGPHGKEYRLPEPEEIKAAEAAKALIPKVFAEIPFGVPDESTPKGGGGASRAFSVDGYGMDRWSKLFTPRQLVALGTFVKHTRAAHEAMSGSAYPVVWIESIGSCLGAMLDQLANRCSSICRWNKKGENLKGTFVRYALPIVWDHAEVNPFGETTAGYPSALRWIPAAVSSLLIAEKHSPASTIHCKSASTGVESTIDLVVTDPPYYDAIPYSDCMDYFYVWLRRTTHGWSTELDAAFREPLGPKWSKEGHDGELIDDSSRFRGDGKASKEAYETGMEHAFDASGRALKSNGRMVIVFAHKDPEAWETLAGAIIRSGFVVDGSWPIQTEHMTRTRSLSSAALSSSVWLVCKKRPADAQPGWDNRVLEEMRENIHARLRDFWDAGIRGPDFVWAATGPALEAYSKHPVVKMADAPGEVMTVSEFLRHVRRMVVEFVVSRVLHPRDGAEATTGLDDVTAYYLLHRNDFKFEPAPAGACILYATSCGLTDRALTDQFDILARAGGGAAGGGGGEDEDADEAGEPEATSGRSGSELRLKGWKDRKKKGMGYEAGGRPAPLVDQVHRLMHLWKGGEVAKVDEYVELQGARGNPLFLPVLQALIELSPPRSDERPLLESISNHLSARGPIRTDEPSLLPRAGSSAQGRT